MIRKLPALDERPETGPMQFGDDWPGVFIRGDNALFFAQAVEQALTRTPKDAWAELALLKGIAEILRSCSVGDTGWPPS